MIRAITRLNIGGPARQALLLTKELSASFPTTLVAGTPSEIEGELTDPAVEVHRVSLVRPLAPVKDLRAARQIRTLIHASRPSILHTHMAKAGSVGRAVALTLRPRPKLVHTFHGHVLEGYFRPAVQRAFIEVERRLARRTDALIAVSPQVRDSLLELGIGTPEKFRVIPLGFDLTEHLAVDGPQGTFRRDIGVAADVPLVGIVGRLAPIKDHVTLFEAMVHTPSAHLAVVGDGELRSDLERRAADLGIAGRVHFAGWRSDVADVMSDLDVVALSSRNEGTPVSLIEALACGRAVVATDVGGVRFVVQDGSVGLIVPAQDPRALAAALAELLTDEDRRARMGAAGRVAVRDRFSHHRLVADIADLYAELLGGRGEAARR